MLLRWIGGSLLAIAAIAFFALQPQFKRYRVPSESMAPTIEYGEKVNLNEDAEPRVGDIVIFHPPVGAETQKCGEVEAGGLCARPTPERSPVTFIKRIVGGPGDRVTFERGHVVRNGETQDEPYIRACDRAGCTYPQPITVPDDMYYLVGDNRGASDDSRHWGPVPAKWILGRAERCHALYFACSPA
jgi:signal peptidase I